MSHPDPLFDPENSYEEDNMNYSDDVDASNYSDYNDFYGESIDYDDYNDEASDDDSYDDSMDGDHESALASAGWGTDEDYGYYGEDVDYREDFHADDAIGYVDYNEDGPYDD
jgi:hypothetical protein